MVRCAALIAMLGALHFGGMALISHEAHSVEHGIQSVKSQMSTITSNFDAGVTALHNANSGSPHVNSPG